jgi:hypothetical protein
MSAPKITTASSFGQLRSWRCDTAVVIVRFAARSPSLRAIAKYSLGFFWTGRIGRFGLAVSASQQIEKIVMLLDSDSFGWHITLLPSKMR